jgi:hypothetical protein
LKAELRAQIKIGTEHGEPLGLVKAAIQHKCRARNSREDRYTDYDEVWCVVDVEAPMPHACLESALQLAKKNGVHIALANPCFELWIRLHFEAVNGYHETRHMANVLEQKGYCGYTVLEKSIEYKGLLGLHDEARSNARKLRRDPACDRRSNPWTNIDELVDRIRLNSANR